MNALRRILAMAILLAAGAVSSWAAGESTAVRFRFGKAEADLSQLEAMLTGPDASRIVGVEVRASSSPDGPYWVNKALAQDRASFIINKVKELCPSLGDDAIKTTVVAEDWAGVAGWLRRSGKTWKDEALKIVTEIEASKREEKLQDLFAGEAWEDMMRNAFPALRSAKVTVLYGDSPKVTLEVEREDSVQNVSTDNSETRILFRAGMRYVEPEFANNAAVIEIIGELLSDGKSLRIASFASPEGSSTANAALAKNRANCVRTFLAEKFGISEDRIIIESGGEDWAGLARETEKSYNGADRDDVMRILSDDSLSAGAKKAALRALNGSATWQHLIANQMATLRSVIVSSE